MADNRNRHARNLTPPRELALHIQSFLLHLRSEGLADRTVEHYRQSACWLAAEHLGPAGVTDWEEVTRDHIREWIVRLRGRGYSDSYVNQQFRHLQQYFRWLAEDEEIDNVMLGMRPPRIVEKPVPVFGDEDIAAIFGTVQGKRDLWSRRDLAILLMLRDTGVRLMELAGMQADDVDALEREARVTGKGKRQRTIKYSHETAKALDKYLRQRGKEGKYPHLAALWVGPRGALTDSGIYQIVQRRAEQAGVSGVHPHRFRHHFAHLWLDRGGAEGDLMELTGWDSPQMLRRYGRSAAASRARRSYDRIMDGEGE